TVPRESLSWQHRDGTRSKRLVPLQFLALQVRLFRRPDRQEKPMQRHRGRTIFSAVVTVTNRLQCFPTHPVARRNRDKRDELLPCLEFFETVFLLSHHCDMPCSTQSLSPSASSVQSLFPK